MSKAPMGLPAAARAIGDNVMRIAAQAGVNSIEHAYTIPNDVLKLMATKQIFLVPTDYPAEFYTSAFGVPASATPEQRQQHVKGAPNFAASNHKRLARAVKAGVGIAAGSDE